MRARVLLVRAVVLAVVRGGCCALASTVTRVAVPAEVEGGLVMRPAEEEEEEGAGALLMEPLLPPLPTLAKEGLEGMSAEALSACTCAAFTPLALALAPAALPAAALPRPSTAPCAEPAVAAAAAADMMAAAAVAT